MYFRQITSKQVWTEASLEADLPVWKEGSAYTGSPVNQTKERRLGEQVKLQTHSYDIIARPFSKKQTQWDLTKGPRHFPI